MISSPPPVEDRLPPMTPQLALRVAVVGTVAFAMFAIVFFRLWFLQVLSGTRYLAQASVNSERVVPVAAPRGEILDRNGSVLVSSTLVPTVEISPGKLPTPITISWLASNHDRPPQTDARLFRRLSSVLGIPNKPVKCQVAGNKAPPNGTYGTFRMSLIACKVAQSVATGPFNDVPIDPDVSPDVQDYLGERSRLYPGVGVQRNWVRQYPDGNLAAQLFGTVGQLNSQEVHTVGGQQIGRGHFKDIPAADVVGQSGLEYQYNQYLQGTDGKQRIKVNALGQYEGAGTITPPAAGENLQLSIDPKLQRAGQQALAQSIALNGGAGGAFVAMDPENGQIYAMGSNPTFNPNVFTKPISKATWASLTSAASGDPLFNRAIQGAGPTGSTFKAITATAALESGVWAPGDTYTDTGQFCFPGTTLCLKNAGNVANGTLDLVNAIRVSDDVFFYHLGYLMNNPAPAGGALQQWAKAFGIGRSTGIDLPGAVTGTLPTPQWRANRNKLEAQCDNLTHPTAMFPNHPHHKLPGGACGLAVYPFESWTVGDNVNDGVGQGDVQVSPLQLSVAYAALANGGNIVTPHVGEDIQSANGTIQQKIDPPIRRHLNIDPTYLSTILQGLRAAASQPGGTSVDVMGNFPEQVYGKTGTAQYFNSAHVETDYAWYACFVPRSVGGVQITNKPIVVVAWVEKGGFGDVAAAPVARQILSQWFFGKPGKYVGGNSRTL